MSSCQSSFLLRKKEHRTAQNSSKISYIPRKAYLRGDYDVSKENLKNSSHNVKELKPAIATTTEFVEEEEFENIRTEIAWSNPDFSSKTPVPEEDFEVLSKDMEDEFSSENQRDDNQNDDPQIEAQALGDDETFGEEITFFGKSDIENNFILCSGSVYEKAWKSEFDRKWLKDNRKKHRTYRSLVRALKVARSKDYVSLVYPNVGDTFYDYPMIINPKVISWINYFRTKGRKSFLTWLRRGLDHIPAMEYTLKEHGLPKDLVYLAMIESGFSSGALSHVGATGPWQFMSYTAKRYGLKINDYVDERRDPYKSSHAAALYLNYLYSMFGDWHLAAASYNAGEGRVLRALKRVKNRLRSNKLLESRFFHLAETRRIPKETRNYVPKIIAAMIIAKNLDKFGFDIRIQHEPESFRTILLKRSISLDHLAYSLGIEKKVLARLNPELRFSVTPPSHAVEEGVYALRVPESKYHLAMRAIEKLPEADNKREIAAYIRRRESISAFAKRHSVSLESILAANSKLSRKSRLYPGQVITLPVELGSGKYLKLISNRRSFIDKAKYTGSKRVFRRYYAKRKTYRKYVKKRNRKNTRKHKQIVKSKNNVQISAKINKNKKAIQQ